MEVFARRWKETEKKPVERIFLSLRKEGKRQREKSKAWKENIPSLAVFADDARKPFKGWTCKLFTRVKELKGFITPQRNDWISLKHHKTWWA